MLDLIETPNVAHGYSQRRYPRVVGLAVYSGEREWSALLDAAEGMGVGRAAERRAVPTFEYRVVDLRRIPLPGGKGNLAVRLQRMQVSESLEALREAALPLRGLGDVEGVVRVRRLARAFALWTTEVLLPGLGVEQVEVSANLEEVLDLLESQGMNWAEKMREQGRRQGRLTGLRELLVVLAERRSGKSTAQSLSKLLETVTDPQRLIEVGIWLDDGMSGDALLARLRHP